MQIASTQQARLDDLGPPQKTRQLNRNGRKLQITTALLASGSCGLSRAFGDPACLARYLQDGATTRMRRRLEADAKSLLALYEYGCLHHAVRLRWGFVDEMIPVPWAHFDEPALYTLLRDAAAAGREVEAVVGTAPGWNDPWARARRLTVRGPRYDEILCDAEGRRFDPRDVQRARIAGDASITT